MSSSDLVLMLWAFVDQRRFELLTSPGSIVSTSDEQSWVNDLTKLVLEVETI